MRASRKEVAISFNLDRKLSYVVTWIYQAACSAKTRSLDVLFMYLDYSRTKNLIAIYGVRPWQAGAVRLLLKGILARHHTYRIPCPGAHSILVLTYYLAPIPPTALNGHLRFDPRG